MDRRGIKSAVNARLQAEISAALERKGMSARAASIEAVGHDGLIRDIKKGNVPTADKIAALAEVLGLDFYFGDPKRRGPVDAAISAAEQDAFSALQPGALEEELRIISGGIPDADHNLLRDALRGAVQGDTAPDHPDFVPVPLHEAELAAGAGAANESDAVYRHLLFRADWMRKLGLAPRNARLARVRGDSMSPLLHDQDVVLIDTSRTVIRTSRRPRGSTAGARHLVALVQAGEARIKWVERPAKDLLLVYSENVSAHPPEAYSGADLDQLHIIGHVVWWCHTVAPK